MLRKKVNKILSVLVAVIIAFSFICIPASAENFVHTYYSPIAKPDLNDNSGYAELLIQYQNGEYGTLVVFWECFTEDDSTSYVDIYCDNGTFIIEPKISSGFGVFSCRTFESNGWNDSTNVLYVDGMNKTLHFGGNIMHCINAHYYGNVRDVNTHPGWEINFEVLYGGEIGNYKSIREIVDELYQIHASNNVIVQFLDYICTANLKSLEFFQHILNENISTNTKLDIIAEVLGSNTDKITQNQDENTDKVIQNQEENQEEIKNGWQQEDDIDTSTTDDYAAKDKELQGATEQGRSEAVSVFNSFGSLFQSDGHLYKGLLSVSAMFTEFLKINWVSSLLNFSLAIGVFAFVIGTGSSIFKSAHEKFESNKQSKYASSERDKAQREGLM